MTYSKRVTSVNGSLSRVPLKPPSAFQTHQRLQNDKRPLTLNVLFLHLYFFLYHQIPLDVAEQLMPEKSKGGE